MLTEKSLFIDLNGKRIFAFFCSPEKDRIGKGVIICQPIAEERSRAKRVLINWIRYLASKGYDVLLFDYFGEGDSDGDFEDADVNSRVNDILASVEFMKEHIKVKNIGLIGLRLGATFAILAGRKSKNIDYIVASQPVCNGNKYIQDWLKVNLSFQFATSKKITSNRSQMIMELIDKGTIEIEGYVLSRKLYDQLVKVDLIQDNMDLLQAMLLIEIKNANAQPDKEIEQFKEFCKDKLRKVEYMEAGKTFDWMNFKMVDHNPLELYQKCFDWMQARN